MGLNREGWKEIVNEVQNQDLIRASLYRVAVHETVYLALHNRAVLVNMESN